MLYFRKFSFPRDSKLREERENYRKKNTISNMRKSKLKKKKCEVNFENSFYFVTPNVDNITSVLQLYSKRMEGFLRKKKMLSIFSRGLKIEIQKSVH